MATTEVDQIRALTDGAEGYTDNDLENLLTAEGSINATARYIWKAKAASYSSLVNVAESGSSRSLGDLYKNALAMASSFGVDPDVTAPKKIKTTRQAVRR